MGKIQIGSKCVCMRDGTLSRCVYEGQVDNMTYMFHEMPSGHAFSVGPAVFSAGVYLIEDISRWPANIVKAYNVLLVKENDDKLKQLQAGIEKVAEKFGQFIGTEAYRDFQKAGKHMPNDFEDFPKFMEEFMKTTQNK